MNAIRRTAPLFLLPLATACSPDDGSFSRTDDAAAVTDASTARDVLAVPDVIVPDTHPAPDVLATPDVPAATDVVLRDVVRVPDASVVDARADVIAPVDARPDVVAHDAIGADAGVRRVFVSSTTGTAALGGTTGADARCTTLAASASLGGTWMAWLSTGTSAVADRFTHAAVPYVLLDGTHVAESWSDLTDGTLGHAIDRDETNTVLAGDTETWTGTSTDGTASGAGCNGFTTDSTGDPYAEVGIAGQADSTWTTVYSQFCDRGNVRIYCFEQ